MWELYLTNEARIAPDHVHDDAEIIEHVLGEETVRQLERTLNHAKEDPHGRQIPGLQDLQLAAAALAGRRSLPIWQAAMNPEPFIPAFNCSSM